MYKPILSAAGITAAAAVMASMLAGCVPTSTVKKDSTFQGKEITPALGGIYVAADLEVAEKKILGRAQAYGYDLNRAALEHEAVLNAFSRDPAGANSADVLVAPHFFYEYDGGSSSPTRTGGGYPRGRRTQYSTTRSNSLTVTVVGYPARYKNFRPDPKHEKNTAILMEPVGDNTFLAYPVQRDKVSGGVEKPAEQTPVPDAYQAPASAPAEPVYHAPPNAPAESAHQTPAAPAQPVYQTPAPVRTLPQPAYSAPAPATELSPVTNTPKE